jgi:DNA-binding PadR family transcriptional regulator
MSSGNPHNKLYRKLFNDSLELVILVSLGKKPMHGSELTAYITEKVDSINSSILYKRLKSLEKEELITSSKNLYSAGTRRRSDRRNRLYEITEMGKEKLREVKEEFNSFTEVMDRLFRYV